MQWGTRARTRTRTHAQRPIAERLRLCRPNLPPVRSCWTRIRDISRIRESPRDLEFPDLGKATRKPCLTTERESSVANSAPLCRYCRLSAHTVLQCRVPASALRFRRYFSIRYVHTKRSRFQSTNAAILIVHRAARARIFNHLLDIVYIKFPFTKCTTELIFPRIAAFTLSANAAATKIWRPARNALRMKRLQKRTFAAWSRHLASTVGDSACN